MSDRKLIAELLERLGGLRWCPRDNSPALKDLARALMSARSETIVVGVVDDWIRYNSDATKPADLYKLIAAENEKAESIERSSSKECQICGGTGQEILEIDGRTGARTCVCRKRATP